MTPYQYCLALVQDANRCASLRAGPPLARSAVPNRRSRGETHRPTFVVGHVLVARGGIDFCIFLWRETNLALNVSDVVYMMVLAFLPRAFEKLRVQAGFSGELLAGRNGFCWLRLMCSPRIHHAPRALTPFKRYRQLL